MHNPVWPNDRIARLHKLVKQPISATEIGRKLSVTRSAVIGFCSRNGIKLPKARKEPKFIEKKPVDRRVVIRHRQFAVEHIDDLPPIGKGMPLMNAGERSCRFPYGDGRAMICCGADAVPTKSYCPYHFVVCTSGLGKNGGRSL